MPRGLCLRGDDGDTLAHEEIHQGRLPDVGVAHDIDEARAVLGTYRYFAHPSAKCRGGIEKGDLACPHTEGDRQGLLEGDLVRSGRKPTFTYTAPK